MDQENCESSLMSVTGTCVVLQKCGGNTGAMEWVITPWGRTAWTRMLGDGVMEMSSQMAGNGHCCRCDGFGKVMRSSGM